VLRPLQQRLRQADWAQSSQTSRRSSEELGADATGTKSGSPTGAQTSGTTGAADLVALEERMSTLITKQVDALSVQLSQKIDMVARQLASTSAKAASTDDLNRELVDAGLIDGESLLPGGSMGLLTVAVCACRSGVVGHDTGWRRQAAACLRRLYQ
jgi:hypothetical protein